MDNINSLLISGAMLSLGGLIAYLVRNIPQKIFQWVSRKTMYKVTVYQQDELFDMLEEYLYDNYKNHYKDVEASFCYEDERSLVPGDGQKKILKFKQEENFFIAKFDGRKILISKTKEKNDKAQTLREIFYRRYVIKGFLAKSQINLFLDTVVEAHSKKKKSGKVKVYTNNAWGDWTCVQDIAAKSFSKIIIDRDVKNDLIKDIDGFVSSAEWYKDRAVRYKRGYLFHGDPGNGKTTVATAMAEYLSRDLYILNLNCLENDSHLVRAFSTIGRNVVLLIEDIDRAFSKRENIDSKISFSSLLNSLDGVLCRDGIITIITTNHIEKLDEALIRDGRIDYKMQINNPSTEQIKEYIELFYGIKIANPIVQEGVSMASVQEFCIKNKDNPLAAINHFSKQKTA